MLAYPEDYLKDFQWIDIPKFPAIMQITGMERGRSAARFTLKDVESGAVFPMFMTDMLALLQAGTINFGFTTVLNWEVCKRGENYGLRMAKV